MSRYNRCKECYNMKCIFVTGEREDIDTSECADFRPMTNADRIRAMTDEELGEFLAEIRNAITCVLGNEEGCRNVDLPCSRCWELWLKSPVEGDE